MYCERAPSGNPQNHPRKNTKTVREIEDEEGLQRERIQQGDREPE